MKKSSMLMFVLFLAVISMLLSCADQNDLDRVIAVNFTKPEIDAETNSVKATDIALASLSVDLANARGVTFAGLKIVNAMPSTSDLNVDIGARSTRVTQPGQDSNTSPHGSDKIELQQGEANVWLMKNIVVDYDLPPGYGFNEAAWDRLYIPKGAALMPEGGSYNTLFRVFDSASAADLASVLESNKGNRALMNEPIVLTAWGEGKDNKGRTIKTNKLRLAVYAYPEGVYPTDSETSDDETGGDETSDDESGE